MEWIDRYIYAVVRLLPEKQREDIEKELRGLIEDMLSERTGGTQPGREDIEAVLKELGEPSALAAQYSGKPRYLIGPELFDIYSKIIKIVSLAAAFGTLIAVVINYAVVQPEYIGEAIGTIIGSVISTAVEAFGMVTLIFALIERSAADKGKDLRLKKEWNPSDLPEIPVKRAAIKRSGPIVSMAFIIVFCIFLNLTPGVFSIYFTSRGVQNVSLFNLDVLRAYLPLINIGFAFSFIREILKLAYGRYSPKLALAVMLLSTVSFVSMMIVFSNYSVWNPDFIATVQQVVNTDLSVGTVFYCVILAIIVISFILDMLKVIYKTFLSGTFDFRHYSRRIR